MFKMAKVVASVAILVAAVGFIPAQASHCSDGAAGGGNDAILFTGRVALPNLGAEGCLANSIVGTDAVDTNFITPGADTASGRYTVSTDPGSFTVTSVPASLILDCDDVLAGTQAPPCTWTTVAGPDLSVPPDGIPDYYDSAQSASLDSLLTLSGGTITITANGESGTWRTVA